MPTMKSLPVAKAKEELSQLVDEVSLTGEAVMITSSKGRAVKIVPVPKPIRIVGGRAVYRLEDLQHLDIAPP